MKELSIEQKARAYDEALERAKEMIKAMTNIGGVAKVDDIQYIFQLNESEDEKIKKCISDVIKEYNREHNWSHIFGVTKDDCLAWLEKQGETFTKKDVDDAYLKGICGAKHELEKQGEKGVKGNEREIPNSEQKPANNQFTPKQADVLDKHIDKFLEQKQDTSIQINPAEYINDMGGNGCYLKNTVQSSAWSDEDEYVFNKILNWVLIVNPTSSIFEKLPKERFIERFKSLRPQINVTDEELIKARNEAYNEALDKLEYHSDTPTFNDGWSAAIWYLKKRNAQPQSQWKPSKEQMQFLLKYAEQCNYDGAILTSLYKDLKKLKG